MKEALERNLFLTLWSDQVPELRTGLATVLQLPKKCTWHPGAER
jgi:hypothetical protein